MSCSCGEGQCLRRGSIGCQQAPQQTSCSLQPIKLQQQTQRQQGNSKPTFIYQEGDGADADKDEFNAGL